MGITETQLGYFTLISYRRYSNASLVTQYNSTIDYYEAMSPDFLARSLPLALARLQGAK